MTDYPQQYGQQPEARRGGSGMAIGALVCGILAILLFWTVVGGILLGLVAFILGLVAWLRARRGAASGKGMALAGWILGVIGALLSIAAVVGLIGLFNNPTFSSYRQCIDDANGNQSKLQQCADEFNRQVNNQN